MYTINCLQCGAEKQTNFKSVRFCNSRCSGLYHGGVPHVIVIDGNKFCGKCRRELPLNCFSEDTNRIDGKQPSCKFCMSMWTRGRTGATYTQMMSMLEQQNWQCSICGDSMKACYDNPTLLGQFTKHSNSISIDHTIPGGKNITLCHQRCNISKSNMTIDELVKWCNKVILWQKDTTQRI